MLGFLKRICAELDIYATYTIPRKDPIWGMLLLFEARRLWHTVNASNLHLEKVCYVRYEENYKRKVGEYVSQIGVRSEGFFVTGSNLWCSRLQTDSIPTLGKSAFQISTLECRSSSADGGRDSDGSTELVPLPRCLFIQHSDIDWIILFLVSIVSNFDKL